MKNKGAAIGVLTSLVIIGACWCLLAIGTMRPMMRGADVVNSHFNSSIPNVSLVDIEGSATSASDEGLLFQKARFKSNELPIFRKPQNWRRLTDNRAIENAIQYLAGEFPNDANSLTAGSVVVFESTGEKSLRFAYNASTHVGCLASGTSVRSQLEELNRYAARTP